jgi:hypothetical protein
MCRQHETLRLERQAILDLLVKTDRQMAQFGYRMNRDTIIGLKIQERSGLFQFVRPRSENL